MITGSSIQAITFTVPPQIRHFSTSISPKAPTVDENQLQPLLPSHGRMTPNWRLLVLAICIFGLVTLAPLRRCHQRTVFAVRGEYTVKMAMLAQLDGPGNVRQLGWGRNTLTRKLNELELK